jgi:hypothetical protein
MSAMWSGRHPAVAAPWIAGWRGAAAVVAFAALLVACALLLLGTEGRSGGHDHGAQVVAVPGGFMRVDAVTPDAPMKMAGMPMPSGPNVKDVPKGFRRFTVAVTLFASGGHGLHVTPDRFRISAAGQAPRRPVDDDRDDVYVPDGTAYPRELTFDVPSATRNVELSFLPGGEAATLRLGQAPAGHAHG